MNKLMFSSSSHLVLRVLASSAVISLLSTLLFSWWLSLVVYSTLILLEISENLGMLKAAGSGPLYLWLEGLSLEPPLSFEINCSIRYLSCSKATVRMAVTFCLGSFFLGSIR